MLTPGTRKPGLVVGPCSPDYFSGPRFLVLLLDILQTDKTFFIFWLNTGFPEIMAELMDTNAQQGSLYS